MAYNRSIQNYQEKGALHVQLFENLNLLKSAYTVCTKPVCLKYGLTQMEFDIIMFLENNPEYDTAADIVRLRRFTKSHVSTALKSLSARGLLETCFHDGNRKSIHLRLLPATAPIIQDGHAAQKRYGDTLFDGFSSSEFALTQIIFQRICSQARLLTEEECPAKEDEKA